MKKGLSAVLAVILICSLLTGCTIETQEGNSDSVSNQYYLYYISSDEIRNALEQSGVYVGKNKIGLDKKQVINNLRINLNDISWAGIDISGTTLKLEVVEKTKIDEDQIQNNSIGKLYIYHFL